MLDTSTRLLGLLSLLQARRDWSGAELADRLEVGRRTIRRDVDRLRRLGYPVQATPGVAGGYRLGPGASLPPLLLDEEEAVAVAVGLRTFRADRIQRAPTPDRRFDPRDPPAKDIVAYVSRGVSAARDRYQARVVLHAPLEQVADRVPPTVGTLEALDANRCLLRTGS